MDTWVVAFLVLFAVNVVFLTYLFWWCRKTLRTKIKGGKYPTPTNVLSRASNAFRVAALLIAVMLIVLVTQTGVLILAIITAVLVIVLAIIAKANDVENGFSSGVIGLLSKNIAIWLLILWSTYGVIKLL